MDKELREKWFDTMDKELQDLFKSGTFEFVSWDKVLKQGKECSNNMGFLQEVSSFWRSLLFHSTYVHARGSAM